ncbi:hypothetical protein PRUPE_1G307500 [Prunus persica]|uniref:Uncharacterized protein n=1 Tax=Prunus persica TaxID=3760 RepID=M5Y3B7_PRUPE|nr:protein PLANT CADMIUM RESISTANCE 9 [Prunus persica]ONI31346.1 hypothetical protein PRUPE_1G307500 [Prunus persica]
MAAYNSNSKLAQPEKQLPQGQWSTGLFDCLDDRSNCLLTCFCPCVTLGRIAEIVDRGTTSRGMASLNAYAMGSIGCGWLYSGKYRAKLRAMFSLPEEPCGDFVLHGCCCVFSICQEYRELKNHGIDPSIGWQANVEKWNREGIKPPNVESGMNR